MRIRALLAMLATFVVLFGACAAPPAPPETPTPTTPTPPPASPPVSTAKYSDSTGDFFDKEGISTTAEAYLDIVETELSLYDGYYIAKIIVNGTLPTQIDDPSIFIEWDVLIDADNNPSTGWNWPLVFGNIGPDYLFRVELKDSQYKGCMLDIKANRWQDIEYKSGGNTVEFRFQSDVIGKSNSFSWVAAVRKYGKGGTADALLAFDKTPNQGCYAFPDTDGDGYGDEEELSVWKTDPKVAEKWDDLDTVTSLLNTPAKVSLYLKREFLEMQEPSQLFAVPVAELFKDMSGDCDEYAMLALYWLAKNGYEAYMVDVYFNKWWQEYNQWLEHDICVYKGEDGLWYSIDIYDNSSGCNPVGPFKSVDEICDQLPSHYGATDWISYKLFDSNGEAVRTVTAEQVMQDFLGPDARKIYTFEQIVPLLDTPDKVSTFMKNNIKWDGDYDNRVCGGNQYDSAWIVYQHGIDDCDGHAILQAYLLERNGWDAYMIGLSIEAPVVGHNVAGVNLSDGKILVRDNEGLERGPFDSLSEVAQFYIKLGWMTAGGSLRTIRASQVTEIMTGGSVLRLPWTFHSY